MIGVRRPAIGSFFTSHVAPRIVPYEIEARPRVALFSFSLEDFCSKGAFWIPANNIFRDTSEPPIPDMGNSADTARSRRTKRARISREAVCTIVYSIRRRILDTFSISPDPNILVQVPNLKSKFPPRYQGNLVQDTTYPAASCTVQHRHLTHDQSWSSFRPQHVKAPPQTLFTEVPP